MSSSSNSPASSWTLPVPPTGIRLADDLVLDPDLAGGRLAVLGKTGTGKSSTSRRFVEEVVAAGDRSVGIYDCMGQWRGIQRGRDGAPGLPFLIAGDDEGDDFDLDHAVEVVEAVNRGHNVVVDVSQRRGPALARKGATLFDELYAEAGTRPIVVVVEEADELAPQRTSYAGQRDSLLAVERLARRGRGRGIGLLVITQRSAAISKGVISQLDVLIAFGSPAPQDRNAISSWIPVDDAPGNREILARLGSLAVGEAIVWQPASTSLSLHQMLMPRTADNEAPAARRVIDAAQTMDVDEVTPEPLLEGGSITGPSPSPAPSQRSAISSNASMRIASPYNGDGQVVWAMPTVVSQMGHSLSDEDVVRIVDAVRAGLAEDIGLAISEALAPNAGPAAADTATTTEHTARNDIGSYQIPIVSYPSPAPATPDAIDDWSSAEQKVLSLIGSLDNLSVADVEAAFVDQPSEDVIGTIAALAQTGAIRVQDGFVQPGRAET